MAVNAGMSKAIGLLPVVIKNYDSTTSLTQDVAVDIIDAVAGYRICLVGIRMHSNVANVFVALKSDTDLIATGACGTANAWRERDRLGLYSTDVGAKLTATPSAATRLIADLHYVLVPQ